MKRNERLVMKLLDRLSERVRKPLRVQRMSRQFHARLRGSAFPADGSRGELVVITIWTAPISRAYVVTSRTTHSVCSVTGPHPFRNLGLPLQHNPHTLHVAQIHLDVAAAHVGVILGQPLPRMLRGFELYIGHTRWPPIFVLYNTHTPFHNASLGSAKEILNLSFRCRPRQPSYHQHRGLFLASLGQPREYGGTFTSSRIVEVHEGRIPRRIIILGDQLRSCKYMPIL